MQLSVTTPNHAARALEFDSRTRRENLKDPYDKLVLLLDHAENINSDILAKFLSEVSQRNAAGKPTLLILIGLPCLESRVQQSRFCSYRSEFHEILKLNGLEPSEVKDYIGHRLDSVGFSGDTFYTDDAIRGIAEFSKGIPGRINKLCGSSLLLASLEENSRISEDVVQSAARFCFIDNDDQDRAVSTEYIPSNRPSQAEIMSDGQQTTVADSDKESLEDIVQMLNRPVSMPKAINYAEKFSALPIPSNNSMTSRMGVVSSITKQASPKTTLATNQLQIPPTPIKSHQSVDPLPIVTADESRPALKPIRDFDVVMSSYSGPGNLITHYFLHFSIVTLIILLSVKGFG